MKFLVDTQLPPALCRWLRERGHEAVHVDEPPWEQIEALLIDGERLIKVW